MALDVGRALQDGFNRLLARNGLLWLVVFVAFAAVNAVVQQSMNRAQFDQIHESEAFTDLFDQLPLTTAEFADLVDQSTPLAYLDTVSLPALLGLVVALAVLAEAIRIVAIRTFVSDETETIPPETLTRRLGWAVVNGIVAGIVVGILVVLGTILFVVPGIFLALSFLFVRQEVAVADKSVVEAIEGSWNLASGERFALLALVVVLLVIWFTSALLLSFVNLESAAAVSFVGVAVDGVVLVYSVAVVSRAYHQLDAQAEAQEDKFEDIDPELLP